MCLCSCVMFCAHEFSAHGGHRGCWITQRELWAVLSTSMGPQFLGPLQEDYAPITTEPCCFTDIL